MLLSGSNDAWASTYGLTLPVFEDHSQAASSTYIVAPGGSFGIPQYAVIDREMQMELRGANESQAIAVVEALLADPVPDVEWPLPE